MCCLYLFGRCNRLVELTDESKAGAAAALVKGVKLSVVGSSADAVSKL